MIKPNSKLIVIEWCFLFLIFMIYDMNQNIYDVFKIFDGVKKNKAHAVSRAVVSCVLLQGAPKASLSPVHSFPVCPIIGDGGREDERWRSRSSDPVVMNPFDSYGSPRHEEADDGDSRCPWARFSSWLECVCVVTFDLELGQAIEVRSGVSLASLASWIIRDASDKTEINDWWILNRPLPYTSLMFCGRCTKLCSKNGPFSNVSVSSADAAFHQPLTSCSIDESLLLTSACIFYQTTVFNWKCNSCCRSSEGCWNERIIIK